MASVITLAQLASALDRLSGDSLRVAVYLSNVQLDVNGWFTADARSSKTHAKKIHMGDRLFRNCLTQLVETGLIHRIGRISFSAVGGSMSPGGHSLARDLPLFSPLVSSDSQTLSATRSQPGDSGSSPPPWEEEKNETRHDTPGEPPGETGSGLTGSSPGLADASTEPNGLLCPKPPGSEVATLSPHKFVVGEFHRMYVDCYETKPSWSGREGMLIKRMLAMHSAEEIVRRMKIMFYEKRRFPQGPYTLSMLSVHFDAFVISKQPGGPVDRDKRKTGESYYGPVSDV